MQKGQKAENEQKSELFKIVFGTEQGKKVLDDLMKRANMNSTGFNAESDRVTSYNLGKKDLCQYILNMITK